MGIWRRSESKWQEHSRDHQYAAKKLDSALLAPSEMSLRRHSNAAKRKLCPCVLAVGQLAQISKTYLQAVPGTQLVGANASVTASAFRMTSSPSMAHACASLRMGWVCVGEVLRFQGKLMSVTVSQVPHQQAVRGCGVKNEALTLQDRLDPAPAAAPAIEM